MANIIFIDNFDSFTYNLVDQFRALGHEVTVYRNHIEVAQIESEIAKASQPIVVLSPGPGEPSQAGNMPQLIQTLRGKVPMIGICLGHQAIIEAYGGSIVRAPQIIHGKISMLTHQPHATYNNLPSPLAIARYHSLVAGKVPDTLTVTAEVDGLVMSVVQEQDRVCGFQFHPESIMTTYGAQLLANTIEWTLQQPDSAVAA